MKEELEMRIRDYEYEEEYAEKEIKMAVSNRQWTEVRKLAQSLCEYRAARWALESALESIEKSQPTHN